MDNIQEMAFDCELKAGHENHLEGHIAEEAYDLQVSTIRFKSPGEGTFNPRNYCYLEWIYHPIEHLKVAYMNNDKTGELHDRGKIIMVPPGSTLLTRCNPGTHKNVSCMLDISKLGLIGGFEWNWDDVELDSTIDFKNPFMDSLMQRLGDEICSPSFASNLQVDCMLTLIAFELRQQFPSLGKVDRHNNDRLNTRQINTLHEMIEESTGIGPSLATLASACNLLPRQLSERFKNTTGVTLRHFVAENRIKKAKTLLMDERLLVKEVAYLSGFQNAAAFTAAFRKATGQTPQEFRDHCRIKH